MVKISTEKFENGFMNILLNQIKQYPTSNQAYKAEPKAANESNAQFITRFNNNYEMLPRHIFFTLAAVLDSYYLEEENAIDDLQQRCTSSSNPNAFYSASNITRMPLYQKKIAKNLYALIMNETMDEDILQLLQQERSLIPILMKEKECKILYPYHIIKLLEIGLTEDLAPDDNFRNLARAIFNLTHNLEDWNYSESWQKKLSIINEKMAVESYQPLSLS